MASNHLISVVIPCFNHEQFIGETIRSVVNSAYSPIEIIVVNDGSTDNSEQVVVDLQKNIPNLLYIKQENAGPSAARNHGIRLAKGYYILPLDADDLIAPNYIPDAISLLNQFDEVKLVYCNAEFFGEKTGKWKLPKYSPKLLARENMIFCSAVYRKSDWERVGGYDERMTWGWEDWEFWIAMMKEGGEVAWLSTIGFYYRVRKNSRRKSTNKEAKRKTINLINEKHYDFVKKYLHGPLRYNRSWSAFINCITLSFIRPKT